MFFITTTAFGQSRFLQKLDFDVSYARVDGWQRQLTDYIIENNDGKALGLAAGLNFNSKLFLQLEYQRAELYNVDLESKFKLGFFTSVVGRKLSAFEKGVLSPKIGISIQNRPTYNTWRIFYTNNNGEVVTNIQREFTGISGFRFWAVGFDFSYPISHEVSIGAGLDAFYSASSGKGSTVSSVFLKMKLFN